MYISRGIDTVLEPRSSALRKLQRAHPRLASLTLALLWRLFGRRRVLTERTIVSERIIEVPFVYQHVFAYPPGSRLLEVGVVGSEFPAALIPLGYVVHGVDVRPCPLSLPGFTFHQTDAADLSGLPAGCFDAVICVSTLEHTGLSAYGMERDERTERATVAQMLSMLAPGGVLLVTVPFGSPRDYDWYRVYDAARLRELLPEAASVSVFRKPSRWSPQWESVPIKDGEQTVYEEPTGLYPVECVACIVYRAPPGKQQNGSR